MTTPGWFRTAGTSATRTTGPIRTASFTSMCTAPTTRMGRFAANWRRNTSQLFELAIKPAPAGFVFSRAPHHLRARLCGAPVVHARTEKGSLLDRSRTVAEAEAVRERDGACALVATQSD